LFERSDNILITALSARVERKIINYLGDASEIEKIKAKKENMTMKMRSGVIVIMLLAGLIIGFVQPAVLSAGETPSGGNLWDPFINPDHLKGGTQLPGTLSIIYSPIIFPNNYVDICNGNYQATMFYSVRFKYSNQISTYEGSTGVCLGNIGTPGTGGQGDVIMSFLDQVIRQIIPTTNKWYIKSISNPGMSGDSLGFVSDILVMVK
jgi:hypothetical protein